MIRVFIHLLLLFSNISVIWMYVLDMHGKSLSLVHDHKIKQIYVKLKYSVTNMGKVHWVLTSLQKVNQTVQKCLCTPVYSLLPTLIGAEADVCKWASQTFCFL